ncbi:sugar ABC transporter substrate-binding protein [Phytoactinopolyspora alkaliphila]|uniref:Sugar ABC transporter substrate-binding protein n=1 Tax=Phytoactinopolyspora alkaliphila TaxID=1783498 RepID=A0A6N9YL61_9ACTN|nr:sugar ABC transporter substrate-binding protein [Phytoactinopolyspora alkaliphila]NED95660.1 sugar ABC transporter substrate-binding protein [Phytoactinopolyspora alkaliphila]
MRTRKVMVTGAALSAVLLASACGGDDGGDANTGASEPGELEGSVTMWTYPVMADETEHRSFWDDTIAAFGEEYPGVDVTVEIFPWADRDQALTTAIAGNSAPDVVYFIPDQLPGYARNIEPIDPYLDDDAKADYLPNAVEAVTIDGQMVSAPILASAVTLTCNKEVFDAVGETEYPQTWDDLREMAPAFKDAGYYMIAYSGDVSQTLNLTFYPLLWQAGGDVFNEDGTDVTFNSDAGVEALTLLQEMVEGEYVAEDMLTAMPPTEQTQLAQGNVACAWHTEGKNLVEFWGEENTVILPPLTNVEQVAYGTVGSLAMLSSADDKDAAGAWIAFVTDAEQVATYNEASGFLPVKESIGSLYDGDPILGEAEKYTDLTTVGPLHEDAREIMGVLAPEIQAVLIGQKEPRQALDDAAQAAQSVLR